MAWPTCTTPAEPGSRWSISWATTPPTTRATTPRSSPTSRPLPDRSRGGIEWRPGPTMWEATPPTRWPPPAARRAAWPRSSCRPTRRGRNPQRDRARPARGPGRASYRRRRWRVRPRCWLQANAPRCSWAAVPCVLGACTRPAASPRPPAPPCWARPSPPIWPGERESRRSSAWPIWAKWRRPNSTGCSTSFWSRQNPRCPSSLTPGNRATSSRPVAPCTRWSSRGRTPPPRWKPWPRR